MKPGARSLTRLAVLCLALGASAAQAAETREALERRLSSVATLIEDSSASRQVVASANPAALAARDKARQLQQQAAAALRENREADAAKLLDEAARELFAGVRQAAPEQIHAAKAQRDFDNRMESVKAMMAAHKRIAAEKGKGAQGEAATKAMEGKAAAAAALAASGQLGQARAALDQVYVEAKQAVEALRHGDTLVRSLNFATKQEEFAYELDRNDTHKMLCKMLLAEKRSSNPALDGMVQPILDQAAQLRQQADALAAKKDHAGAVRLLEESTRELVRAIRSAGVYIPG
jgi:hypothetical protein